MTPMISSQTIGFISIILAPFFARYVTIEFATLPMTVVLVIFALFWWGYYNAG